MKSTNVIFSRFVKMFVFNYILINILMANISTSFSFVSFNCYGVKNKIPYINMLCEQSDIIFLQETWLMPHETNFLDHVHSDFNNFSMSSVDAGSLLIGRPYGGLSILYKKSLTINGNILTFDDERLLGFEILSENLKYLFINVYLPYYSEENMHDFTMYMGKLESIVEESEVNGVVIVGDFNSNPRTEYYAQLQQLCEDQDLIISDTALLPADSYTHLNNSSLSKSWLDHCVMSQSLHHAITNIFIDNDISISDHFPLFVTIDFNGLPKGIKQDHSMGTKIKWNFTKENKRNEFYEELMKDFDFDELSDFSFCQNRCNCIRHWSAIESRWSEFVKSVNRVGYAVFGNKKAKQPVVPGWKTHLKDAYSESKSAFKEWRRCGSPREGPEAIRMRSFRARFKHAMRRCRQDEETHRANAMSRSLASGDVRAFWRGVAKGDGAETRPDRIDGAVGDEDVADLWANKYGQVLNSLKDEELKKEFYQEYDSASWDAFEPVTVVEMGKIVSTLKDGKANGLDDIPNALYRHSPFQILYFLASMCNSIMIHEYIPEEATNAKIMPLLKGKLLDISRSENYRPITISTSFSKIIEHIIYTRMNQQLKCNYNQFGYKPKTSTEMCILSLKETINYYHKKNTPVFACYLDVKSAFDKISHWKMFSKLLSRGVSKKIISLLVFWYTNQKMCVSWGGQLSRTFYMSNGIKQGSLISPYIFNVYVECLNDMLNNSGLGCCIGTNPLNNLSWADDLVILSPSSHAMQDMLKICDNFAKEHLMIFNTKKTKCMLFPSSQTPIFKKPITVLSGKRLEYVDSFTYLGHIITSDLKDDNDISSQNRKLCARGNMLIRAFKACTSDVKCYLFRTYCYSIYGAALWSTYRMTSIDRLRVNYNNILRSMLNVPPWNSAS